tara:strand:+ start:1027 stop:1518 length:492 start_codon:yes stop_codon:yes gene_type:complete
MGEKPLKKTAPKKGRKKKPKNTDKAKHYVNSKEFLEELKAYYETDNITDNLAQMVTKIANGLSYAPNFINYSYKDEMVGDAILKMFSALKGKKFDITSKHNPFSYYTTIAFHAFINRIKKEKKYRETVNSYQETIYADLVNSNPGSNIYTNNNTNNTSQELNE